MSNYKEEIVSLNDASLEDLQNNSNMIGMYAFYDTKAERHDTPFFCQNDMFAGRHYKMVVDKKGTMLNKFKTEFDVHRLGFFNSKLGIFTEKFETIIEGHLQKKELNKT